MCFFHHSIGQNILSSPENEAEIQRGKFKCNFLIKSFRNELETNPVLFFFRNFLSLKNSTVKCSFTINKFTIKIST